LIANERITLELIDGMFIIEDVETPILGPILGKKEKVNDLKSLMESESFLRLDSIDYDSIMNKETPLLSRNTEVNYFLLLKLKKNLDSL